MEDGRLTFVVPEELNGERLDRVVAVEGGMSRASARAIVDSGDATVDGEVLGASARLRAGQVVTCPQAPVEGGLEPEAVEFGVVHEDADVMVVDKPFGLVVHPGAGQASGTLASGILERHPEVEGVGQPDRWGLVHRLDRDTSGLLVVALNDAAYRSLGAQVRSRSVEREYLALVDGELAVPTGTVDAPIARDPARTRRRRVTPDGKPARTHYQVEEAYPAAGMTLLRVRLETGRTHQIRVHLAAIDHPLAGDPVYRLGPDRVPVPRLFLHATRLAFDHPATGERLDFTSPLPPDLAAARAALRP